MLYGFAVLVGDDSVEAALDPDWLAVMAQDALFCLCAARPGCGRAAAARLRQGVVHSRLEPDTPLLLLDWDGDVAAVNKAISPYAAIGSLLGEGEGFPFQV